MIGTEDLPFERLLRCQNKFLGLWWWDLISSDS